MKLALDAMGGDHAPAAAVEGAALFAREAPEHQVVLVGDAPRVQSILREAGHAAAANLSVRHATQVVDMGDHAAQSIRKKKDSSLRVCFELCKAGEADAVVSAGHSGAVMAGALLVLGRMKLVERPAFAALMPALRGGGRCLLLDAGANVECKPSQLAQFAVMGEAYVRAVLQRPRPRVALLSNGEEPTKGTDLTRAAYALLQKSDLDFRGYVEGKDIFSGEVEVV
ncbi:MAG TPA: phosphate acyltransferase, partial [Myxococcales bacterium]|nr:phosphate acyltransferase [Myxococcales bacterium]